MTGSFLSELSLLVLPIMKTMLSVNSLCGVSSLTSQFAHSWSQTSVNVLDYSLLFSLSLFTVWSQASWTLFPSSSCFSPGWQQWNSVAYEIMHIASVLLVLHIVTAADTEATGACKSTYTAFIQQEILFLQRKCCDIRYSERYIFACAAVPYVGFWIYVHLCKYWVIFD